MKHLFLLFLAVNIGLFVWGYQREQAVEYKKAHARADVGDLLLLSEQNGRLEFDTTQEKMSMQEPAYTEENIEQDSMPVTAAEADAIAIAPEVVEEEPPSVPESEIFEDAQVAQQEEYESSQQTEQSVPIELTEVVDALVGDAERLDGEPPEQLEEGRQPEKETEAEQTFHDDGSVGTEPQALNFACYKLGPIGDLAATEALSTHLTQLGLDAETRKQRIKQVKGYWVMYPPQETYVQAKQKQQEIKEAGITDLWLFPKGEYKNAISLGLFSRRSNAEAAQKRAQAKGVTTEVLPRYDEVDRYWLEFQSNEQPPVAEEPRLALHEEYPNEKFDIQPCSTVVTE